MSNYIQRLSELQINFSEGVSRIIEAWICPYCLWSKYPRKIKKKLKKSNRWKYIQIINQSGKIPSFNFKLKYYPDTEMSNLEHIVSQDILDIRNQLADICALPMSYIF